MVVAFGRKAQSRLARLGIEAHPAFALAPPGCNYKGAQASWEAIPALLEQRHVTDTCEASLNCPRLPALNPVALPTPAAIWSDDEMERMRRGHRAEESGDNWEAYFEGDDLHLVRAPTGFETYAAHFERGSGEWFIASATVETNPDRYRVNRLSWQSEDLCQTVDALLLDRYREIAPRPS